MFNTALLFFLLALIAGMFGFSGLAGTAAPIGQLCAVGFLILCVLDLLARRRGRA